MIGTLVADDEGHVHFLEDDFPLIYYIANWTTMDNTRNFYEVMTDFFSCLSQLTV